AGVVSQAEPRPVLFRIQGDAIAALHNGEEQRIDLDGCSIGGSAYGDLSSERVYVRTQNMTCARDPKTVIERNVKAYIAGSAKAGVRGEVVSREGDFITTALLAGVVSGFGRGLSQSSSGSLGGITIQQGTQERSTGDVFQQGLGEGLSTSSDRISNYLIRRAEQYQPVIMLQAGRDDVEIVFLEGVDLSDNYKASAKAEEAKPASNSMPNARNPNL
ncbi:MAG: TraB/VirB10 family protein, partial [Alphaproteobacteria bacterium]|nr:TraB/VirB10 family protein [Alphaproteobacteria bacterium]